MPSCHCGSLASPLAWVTTRPERRLMTYAIQMACIGYSGMGSCVRLFELARQEGLAKRSGLTVSQTLTVAKGWRVSSLLISQ